MSGGRLVIVCIEAVAAGRRLWPLDTAAVSCGRRGIRRLSVEALATGRRLCPLDAAATCRLSVEALAAGRSGRWTPALAAGRNVFRVAGAALGDFLADWFQNGFRLVSDWFPTGFRLVSDWCQTGFRLVSDWFQIGF